MIWPFTEEATSTAPAFSAGKPTRFISGMVKVPVITVLAIEDQAIRTVTADDTTAPFAGPPRRWPSSAKHRRLKQLPAPALSITEPTRHHRQTLHTADPKAAPNPPKRRATSRHR